MYLAQVIEVHLLKLWKHWRTQVSTGYCAVKGVTGHGIWVCW